MQVAWTPTCSLKNMNMTENETVFEYVDDCGMHSTRRLRINITDPSENETETMVNVTERPYNLTIENIPTYNYQQDYVDVPLLWIGKSGETTVPYYKTNRNNFNATANLSSFGFNNTNKQLLQWENNRLGCYRGTYQCKAKLIIKSEQAEKFEYDIEKIASSGIHEQYFLFDPSIITAKTGRDLEFDIAPKSDTVPGEY